MEKIGIQLILFVHTLQLPNVATSQKRAKAGLRKMFFNVSVLSIGHFHSYFTINSENIYVTLPKLLTHVSE